MTDRADDPKRVDHLAIAVLGIVTIVAYGSWYYAFGVLLDPIRVDTGWAEANLAASFAVGGVTIGVGSIVGGRLLDLLGSRSVFIAGGLLGGAGLLVVASADSFVVFAPAAVVAMGALGALGFYHVTMTTVVRVNPHNPSRAIAVLTIWGAFSSAIYLPTTAALVNRLDWRDTVRWLALVVVITFAVAAIVIPGRERPDDTDTDRSDVDGTGTDRPSIASVLASTVGDPRRRAFTAAVALGGVAASTVLVYQVPTMTAVGLPLSTAAAVAGLRGAAQTLGRVPLDALVRRLGSDGALVLALSTLALGGGLLVLSARLPVAIAFALATGFGIGAFSPLQGIISEQLFDRQVLGVTMGAYSAVFTLFGAAGPAVAGLVADSTGERRLVAVIVVAAAAGGAVAAWRLRQGLRRHGDELVSQP
jgi:predicted MFS family arabinose efflux permease